MARRREIQSRRGVIEDYQPEGEITVIQRGARRGDCSVSRPLSGPRRRARALVDGEQRFRNRSRQICSSEVVRTIRTRKGLPPEPYDEAYYAA